MLQHIPYAAKNGRSAAWLTLVRIIHGAILTRSVSEDWVASCPRLRFGLVWRAVRRD
jgi:hypothetical protein